MAMELTLRGGGCQHLPVGTVLSHNADCLQIKGNIQGGFLRPVHKKADLALVRVM
ncbi:MAG: hypothetical protein M1353_02995 [Nitrospirae bacterium]|nr:hypothetical protein [Nitrospirota bacterium]